MCQCSHFIALSFHLVYGYLKNEDQHQLGSVKMLSKSHQLDQLDDAGRGLEVPDVESDLQGLGVGAGVRHHGHVGLGRGLGGEVRPVTVGVHHPEILRHKPAECSPRSGKRPSEIKLD